MKKIADEDRALAFAQEQPIPVVEMLINLMSGVVRRRKAAEKGEAEKPTARTQSRPRKAQPVVTNPNDQTGGTVNQQPSLETGQAGKPLEAGQASGSTKV